MAKGAVCKPESVTTQVTKPVAEFKFASRPTKSVATALVATHLTLDVEKPIFSQERPTFVQNIFGYLPSEDS
jgi:hypothetical protein